MIWDHPDENHDGPNPPATPDATGRSVLYGVLQCDRYQITEPSPLGVSPATDAEKLDHSRARAALRRLTPKTRAAEPQPASTLRNVPGISL